MALFKSIRGEMSGTIGGEVYSRNRGGTYIRAWARPTNPNSPAQQAVRTNLADVVVMWMGLTALQRASWETYGANVAMTNRLGDTVYLTGQQHFIRSATVFARMGEAVVPDGPTVFSLPEVGTVTVAGTAGVAGVGTVDVIFDDTQDWCDEDGAFLVVSQSREMAPTINFFKGPYRYAGNLEGDSVTPPASPCQRASVFDLTADNKVAAFVRVVRADGRASNPVQVQGLIV